MTEKKKYNFVYLTTNLINGKKYIGDHSTNDLNDCYIGTGSYIKRAIKKYGKNNFGKQILENFETKKEAFDNQEKYINEYNTLVPNGYNISPKGGLGNPGCHSKETKNKIGKSNKGKPYNKGFGGPKFGKDNPMFQKSVYKRWVEVYGIEQANKLMEEYSQILSKSIKGKTKGISKSKESIERMKQTSLIKFGVDNPTKSLEVREKISNSLRGNIPWNKGLKMNDK